MLAPDDAGEDGDAPGEVVALSPPKNISPGTSKEHELNI